MGENIEKISINCATKIEQLNQVYGLLCDFRDNFGKYKRMNETEEKIFSTLYDLYEKEDLKIYLETEKEIEEFFKNKIGKYWNMKVIVHSNNHEYVQEYVMYLYNFIKENHYFFAVKSSDIHECNTHVCEIKDTSFSVDWFLRGNTTIEMEEITKEEFVSIATKGVKDILDYRLMRLANESEEEGTISTHLSNV